MFCTIMSTFTPASASGAEDRRGDAGAVLHIRQRQFRLVTGIGHTGHGIAFHDILLGTDKRARLVAGFLETGQHPKFHAVAHRQFHRPGLQHLRAQRRQFQHLLEGDPVELPGLRGDPRVGGVDPVHIGVDVAALRPEGGGEGHGGGVRPAAAQRGDPSLGADPLEARDDGHAHALGRTSP
jgi:hypothetical protein